MKALTKDTGPANTDAETTTKVKMELPMNFMTTNALASFGEAADDDDRIQDDEDSTHADDALIVNNVKDDVNQTQSMVVRPEEVVWQD